METRKRHSRNNSSHSLTGRLTQAGRALLGSTIGSAILVILAGPFWSVSGLGGEEPLTRVLFASGGFACSVGIVTWYARRG